MNLYFLVEGRRTERKVYPAWLAHLVPKLKRVDYFKDLDDCCYMLFSGEGYPSLLDKHLPNAIKDYQRCQKLHRLVVCLDVDDSNAAQRVQQVQERALKYGLPIDELRVIPQDCCIETWFLGNNKAVSPNPQSTELARFMSFYNVRVDDPELMQMPIDFSVRSLFHSRYFHLVSQDKNFNYTKRHPRHVVDRVFLDELIARRAKSNHLDTFGNFLALCTEISSACP
jgi:hypothetical protein